MEAELGGLAAKPVLGADGIVGDTDELAWVGWMPLAEDDERMAEFGGCTARSTNT